MAHLQATRRGFTTRSVARGADPPARPALSADVVLREAEMLLTLGGGHLDPVLAQRLEGIVKDLSLSVPLRARALSLLCRMG